MPKNILVTGAAGFIGFHICKKLLKENTYNVIGFDNINNYYDISLKNSRLFELNLIAKHSQCKWVFEKSNLEDYENLNLIFAKYRPSIVIHLAAQAGVRYSLKNSFAYINSNIVGFHNIIECAKVHKVENFIYASSSSVYGGNKKLPYSEKDPVNQPVSIYASTKRSNELLAHSYSNLYNIPCTGLRFFTVYGPWGRPDMAPFIFTKAILNNEPINVFNNGNLSRDFTYIDDVCEVIARILQKPANSEYEFENESKNLSSSSAKHRIFNVGNKHPIKIMDFIQILEGILGIKATKNFKEMQKGDVKDTYADTILIEKWINYSPKMPIENGLKLFINWYKNYYKYN